jgi:hypothetical protein
VVDEVFFQNDSTTLAPDFRHPLQNTHAFTHH